MGMRSRAKLIAPKPPSHCVPARQNSTVLLKSSGRGITLKPVVQNPATDSTIALSICRRVPEST